MAEAGCTMSEPQIFARLPVLRSCANGVFSLPPHARTAQGGCRDDCRAQFLGLVVKEMHGQLIHKRAHFDHVVAKGNMSVHG